MIEIQTSILVIDSYRTGKLVDEIKIKISGMTIEKIKQYKSEILQYYKELNNQYEFRFKD